MTPRRWAVLVVIALGTLNAALVYGTMAPIAIPVSKAYQLSSVLYVNFTLIAQMTNPIPMAFLSVWMYSNFPTRRVILFAATLQLVGTALRASSYYTRTFWPVCVGQIISTCSNVFFNNVQLIIANRWFPDDQRNTASALLLVASPLGTGISYGLSAGWFAAVPTPEDAEDEELGELIFNSSTVTWDPFLEAFLGLVVFQFFMTIVIFILLLIVVKEKPDTPPSAVSTFTPPPLTCIEVWHTLRDNRNFSLLLLVFGLPFGVCLMIGSFMSNIFDPFDFKPAEVAVIALGVLLSGVAGAVVFGVILDKWKKFKCLLDTSLIVLVMGSSILAISMFFGTP